MVRKWSSDILSFEPPQQKIWGGVTKLQVLGNSTFSYVIIGIYKEYLSKFKTTWTTPAKCWFETDSTVLKIKSYSNKRHYSRQHKHISSRHISEMWLEPLPPNTRLTCWILQNPLCPWVPWLVLRQHRPHDTHIQPTRCQQHLIGSCRRQRWEPMREGTSSNQGWQIHTNKIPRQINAMEYMLLVFIHIQRHKSLFDFFLKMKLRLRHE